jgi:YD repeat-containing protein
MNEIGDDDVIRGYYDARGKLTWITDTGDSDRRRLTWEGDRLVRNERMAEGKAAGASFFNYGSKGELVKVVHLRDVGGERKEVDWWRGTYQGKFGAVTRPTSLGTFRLLDDEAGWPPHLPLVEALALPSFTGKLDVTTGWPDSMEVHCDVTADNGRCVDEYERVTILKGLLIQRMENPKPKEGLDEKTRDYTYEGDRLTKIVLEDENGKETYVSTFSWDAKGRVVEVHHTDFGATDVTKRLEWRCDDVR